jgi:hypothetical protein
MRGRCTPLARLSDRHVAWIARPWLASGWTPADVLHALDWQPPATGGKRWQISAAIAEPGAWARWRLGHWRHPDGTIMTPVSQLAAQADAARRAAQAERDAARRAVEASRLPDHAQADAAASARGQLAAASQAAAAVIARSVIGQPAPARFRRAAAVAGPADEPPAGSVAGSAAAAATTEPPAPEAGLGRGIARALAAITDPDERDALTRAWRARRAPAGTGTRAGA